MMEILKRFRAVVFGTIALFLYLFGYKCAKESMESQHMKGELNAVKTAKKAYDRLSNSSVIDWLHKKYRR